MGRNGMIVPTCVDWFDIEDRPAGVTYKRPRQPHNVIPGFIQPKHFDTTQPLSNSSVRKF